MDFSARLLIDFGGGQPAHYDVDFSLAPHPDDGSPQVGLKAVQTMAGVVLDHVAQPYEAQIKAEAVAWAQRGGFWPLS